MPLYQPDYQKFWQDWFGCHVRLTNLFWGAASPYVWWFPYDPSH